MEKQFIGMTLEEALTLEDAWLSISPMAGYYDEAEGYEVEGYGAEVTIGPEFGPGWSLTFSLDGICEEVERMGEAWD